MFSSRSSLSVTPYLMLGAPQTPISLVTPAVLSWVKSATSTSTCQWPASTVQGETALLGRSAQIGLAVSSAAADGAQARIASAAAATPNMTEGDKLSR